MEHESQQKLGAPTFKALDVTDKSLFTGKWQVMVRRRGDDGKVITKHLGTYATMEEAAKVFENYKRSLPGFVPPEQRDTAA